MAGRRSRGRRGASGQKWRPEPKPSSREARWVRGQDVSILAEVEYILGRAAECDSRIVTLGSLILFSASSGDAWILDPGESCALALAEAGHPLEVSITETAEQFAIPWSHAYWIDEERMTFQDHSSGRSRVIVGYPTHEIQLAVRNLA